MEKWIYAGLFVAILAGSHAMAYKTGTLSGALEVQTAWDKSEKARTAQIRDLQTGYTKLEVEHLQKVKELEDDIREATTESQNRLAAVHADYSRRLQQSDSRAAIYQRQAQGSATERDGLAEHAARLDRSLEEGRRLVREFRETLRQREVTIKALGGIIQNDRTLLETE